MRYRSLGTTGLQVSPLCLGAMMFGQWGNADHNDSISIIHAGMDAGINFIDTADVYSAGESEEIVGKAIAGRRDEVVLATKFYASMGTGPNRSGGSRYWIMKECEASLRRLGTDHIDLYQVHRPDSRMDVDETLGAMTDLVRQGKVRYLGSSTYPASAIVEAQRGLWFAIPLLPMFVIFFISTLAETNRHPFDLPEAESELVAGYQVEYSSVSFVLFFLAEYANMVLISVLASLLFLGGWLSPLEGMPVIGEPSVVWLLAKTSFFLFLFLWFRATFPRYRYDQIMRLGWKVFLPITIVWIVIISAMVVTGIPPWFD